MRRGLLIALLGLGLTSSVSTVSSSALAQPQPPSRTCWCFSWVHGPDFGRDCLPTRRRCERDRTSSGRDTTACERSREPECVRDGWINGEHFRLPVR